MDVTVVMRGGEATEVPPNFETVQGEGGMGGERGGGRGGEGGGGGCAKDIASVS